MANFNLFIPKIQQAEGGYQDDIEDVLGNYNSLGELVGTNFGISAPVYETFLGYPPSVFDMLNLTQETALHIFKRNYWDKLKADQINNQAVAEMFVDHYINAPKKAVLYMQQAINELGVDNIATDNKFGNQTLNAINNQNPLYLFQAYKEKRLAHYENIKNWNLTLYKTYIKGWKKRVNDLYNEHIDFLKTAYTVIKQNPKKTGFFLVFLIGLITVAIKNS